MTLLLRNDEIVEIASVDTAIEAMSIAFALEGEGKTGEPQRFDIPHGHGWLRLLAAVVPGLNAFGFKAMNLTQGIGVRYVISVCDLETGELRGILDAQAVTAMRTAAATAVATRVLAVEDVERVAIIGTGAEARTHLESVLAVRPAKKVSVYSRSARNRAAFVETMTSIVKADIAECASIEEALAGAGVIVLATKSAEPVLYARHLEPGMHVNSIGSARRDQFELAADTFAQFSSIVCDSKVHVFAEAGDMLSAVEQAICGPERATNLGELVAGRGRGRQHSSEITLYKSVGTAIQDIVLASHLLDLAKAAGRGQELDVFPKLKPFDKEG